MSGHHRLQCVSSIRLSAELSLLTYFDGISQTKNGSLEMMILGKGSVDLSQPYRRGESSIKWKMGTSETQSMYR